MISIIGMFVLAVLFGGIITIVRIIRVLIARHKARKS
jgi:hypothetical protein